MGGKHSGGGDDQSDEYEDRQPDDDEDLEDAQATVAEAAGRAGVVAGGSTGPDVERDDVEASLGIDLDDTERVTADSGGTFVRLAAEQRAQLLDTIVQRYGPDTVARVWYEQLTGWKESSYPRPIIQAHELLASQALGFEAPIRAVGDRSEIDLEDPSEAVIELYQELTAASRAFLKTHYGEEFRLYRGVREQTAGLLAAQAIDHPEREIYYFSTSVLVNYTTDETVAERYGEGIIVEARVGLDEVALATDHVKPHSHEAADSELHVKGGQQFISSGGVRHTTRQDRPLSETVAMMESPSELSISEHYEVEDLVEMMDDNEVRVRTEEGAARVRGWYEAYKDHPRTDSIDIEALKPVVEYVTTVEERRWNLAPQEGDVGLR